MEKMSRFLLLILFSAVTLFLLYPVLHEAGHAITTWLLGGRVSGFSLTPLPHIESGLPYDAPGKIATVSIAGLIFPLLICVLVRHWRGYRGYCVLLTLIITAIAGAVELCVAIQYQMGDIVSGDDIVLFLSSSGANPIYAYLITGIVSISSIMIAVSMKPLNIIEEIAGKR